MTIKFALCMLMLYHPSGIGFASWYGKKHNGHRMANGQVFNASELLAASPSLPLGTVVKVTNLRNGLAVVVQIMDRGPFVKGRILDLSEAAAKQIGCHSVCKVKYEVIKEK